MLKVGIVGMGGIGRLHAGRYLQLPNAEIAAIADILPERLSAENDVQVNVAGSERPSSLAEVARYGEGLELIRKADVDVVDICLPTYLHAPYSIAALEAGHHVICEKPMALTASDATRMTEAAHRTNRRLMIAQVIRFWPEYRFLQESVRSGTFGPLRSLNMWRIGGRPLWSADNWYLNPALSGGTILDLHIHDVDYANAVFGLPDRILASGRISENAKTHDVIHAIFGYENGPQVHMHAGWSPTQIPFEAGFEAWFDRAFLRYDEGKLEVFDRPDMVESHEVSVEPGDGYLKEISYFLDCVATDAPPAICLPESTRDSLTLIQREIEAIGE